MFLKHREDWSFTLYSILPDLQKKNAMDYFLSRNFPKKRLYVYVFLILNKLRVCKYDKIFCIIIIE